MTILTGCITTLCDHELKFNACLVQWQNIYLISGKPLFDPERRHQFKFEPPINTHANEKFEMKKCPKCKSEHNKPGIYCSYKCSNSRTFSEQTCRKKSRANRAHWKQLTPEQKQLKQEHLATIMPHSKGKYLNAVLKGDWDKICYDAKRLRVILEQEGKCNKCKNSEWLGRPITLEYEHKDGNHENNARDNVEALCPNCHSQTPTWRGRKNGIRQARVLEYLENQARLV